MNKETFIQQHQERLRAFCRMSSAAGRRSDYVQGGGGNTSCKLDDRLMAIKASGYALGQIREDQAYAVLDYPLLRDFYDQNRPQDLDDVEQAGAQKTQASVRQIEGMPSLKPSVESGFHAMLDRFVLHSHSVYANLLTCAEEGEALAAKALADLAIPHHFVPYINPGARLTFEIARIRRQAAAKNAKALAIFMENHGLIISADDEKECLFWHEAINERLAASFQLRFADWPAFELKEAGGFFVSQTPALQRLLRRGDYALSHFTLEALYPDQLVFLNGQTAIVKEGCWADHQDHPERLAAKATIFWQSGEVAYRCNRSQAMTIEQTLHAVLFIRQQIARRGLTLRLMDEASKAFIMNWDSEHYRQQIAEQS